ncbi:MAG: L,D-transpeptidase [Rubellimicrobium sp.]|nr:L,D-transpeptidase [Rubellimicrobium sp.]
MKRRDFLFTSAAVAAAGVAGSAMAQGTAGAIEAEGDSVARNTSGLQMRDWRAHFPDLRNGAILCDTEARALHFWSEDESIYLLQPTSVPRTEELTRRGRTEVVRKAEWPTWRPTPSMLSRFPDWPTVIEGGDPLNPLGARAMYLTWPAYLLHGTQDTRKIGRRSSDGCIGMYNEHAIRLYDLVKIGTQVLLI